jgi:serine/threonine protein kinase
MLSVTGKVWDNTLPVRLAGSPISGGLRMINQKQNEASGFTGHESDPQLYLNDARLPQIIGGNSILQPVRRHGKLFFLKRLKPELQNDTLFIDSLNREFEVGYKLEHPNIVRYVDRGTDEHGPYIIIEYIDGINLFEYKQQHLGLSESEIKRLSLQLLDAMGYLHSHQVYHSDIKPDNIIITRRGANTRLIDFGHVNTDGRRFKGGGTNGYASPEQTKNPEQIGPQSDLYALGKVVEFLLNGCPDNTTQLKEFARLCTTSDKEHFNNANEATVFLHKRSLKKSYAVLILGMILILALGAWWYKSTTNRPASIIVQAPQSDAQKERVKATELEPILVSSKTIEESQAYIDSVAADSIGRLLYAEYQEKKSKLQITDMKSLNRLHSALVDSISTKWYGLSEKLNPASSRYKNSFTIYQARFNEGDKKIMKDIFGKGR